MDEVTIFQVRFQDDVNAPPLVAYTAAAGFDDAEATARECLAQKDPDRAWSIKCDSVSFVCRAIFRNVVKIGALRAERMTPEIADAHAKRYPVWLDGILTGGCWIAKDNGRLSIAHILVDDGDITLSMPPHWTEEVFPGPYSRDAIFTPCDINGRPVE